MFYVVETVQQLQNLGIYQGKPCFIDIIPFSEKVHPKLGEICAFYYRPLSAKKGFILPINHLETLSLDFQTILAFLRSLEAEIWTIDKKVALHYGLGDLPLKGLKMAYAMKEINDFPEIEDFDTFAHQFYQRKLNDRLDENRFIPISKHYEKYEKLFKTLVFPDNIQGYDFYNGKVTENFYKIEDNGIGIDLEMFMTLHPGYIKHKNILDNKIYTEFSFYNITTRPICKFAGINFLNLKKDDSSRKFITHNNDILVEFDYKSYQVKLMSDLLGFSFTGNIHEELARQYYNIPPGAPVEERQYKMAKLLTFRYMYGRDRKYEGKIEFYHAIYMYRDELWKQYRNDGYITSPISGRRLYNISEITQLMPFLMQCIETERNTLIIEKLNNHLRGYKTKLVLYTYDAFLLDFSFEDGKSLIEEIKKILEVGDFQTSIKYGENYGELESFDLTQPIFI